MIFSPPRNSALTGKHIMKAIRFAALSCAALSFVALGGCTQGSLDAQIGQSLPVICQDGSVLFAAFTAASATMKPATVAKVNAAFNALSGICADPAKATPATLLVEAATAYANFTLAVKKAK